MKMSQTVSSDGPRSWSAPLAAMLLLAACLLWSHWPTLVELQAFWSRNADYSAGQLVPLVALALAWRKRQALRRLPVRPAWAGALLLVGGEVLRWFGLEYGVATAERLALPVSLAGVVWLAAGHQVFRQVFWILAFLLLMIPWPSRVHEAVAIPLQHIATLLAAAALELLGFFVVREGHVLRLDDQLAVGVTEACSGLRMLTAFIFVSATLALLVDRPRWQRIVLLLASLPIAVLSNAVRSTATAVFFYAVRDAKLNEQFHDAAGLAMMPLGLLLCLGLLRFMSWLSAPDPAERAAPRPPSRPPQGRPGPSRHRTHHPARPCGADT